MTDTGQNTDDVYERVRGAILDGELAAGTVMSQVALAEELGISRTPLREALRLLQGEGLIEAEPNRRVRVAPMTASDMEELCVMRVTLEAEARRLSVPMLAPEDLAHTAPPPRRCLTGPRRTGRRSGARRAVTSPRGAGPPQLALRRLVAAAVLGAGRMRAGGHGVGEPPTRGRSRRWGCRCTRPSRRTHTTAPAADRCRPRGPSPSWPLPPTGTRTGA